MLHNQNLSLRKVISILMLMSPAFASSAQTTIPNTQTRSVIANLDTSFLNPPNLFRVIQYTSHDGALMPFKKLQDYGVGGILLFQSSRNYLHNDSSWANIKTNVRLAKKAGMQVWIGDDNGFPSGQAGGQVVAANPAFEARCLTPLVQRGSGTVEIHMDLPQKSERFLTAIIYPEKNGQPKYAEGKLVKVNNNLVSVTGLEGPWIIEAFALEINDDSGSPAMLTRSGFGTTGHYPNLLDSAAMDKYVELTHDEYLKRLGPLKGQIDVFYSNEPRTCSTWETSGVRPSGETLLPWVEDMPKRFQQDHGYDLIPYLPALFSGNTDEDKVIRRHFYQTLGNIFAQNYTGRLRRWAEIHGIRTSGHLNHEERMSSHVIQYGDFFQAMREQSIPGIDCPMPDLGKAYFEYFPGHVWDFWFPKQVSSIAQLKGEETVSCLIDPIVNRKNPTVKPDIDVMVRSINMLFLTGVNQISSYVKWYDYSATDYHQFNDYVGRLGVMLRGAKNVSNVAMYYPIETFQSQLLPSPKAPYEAELDNAESLSGQNAQEKIVKTLYENGCDFSWLDHKAVLGAKITDNYLEIGGYKYSSIIMPHVNLLPLAVMKKLKLFEKAGGKVLWVDCKPRLGDQSKEHELIRSAVSLNRSILPEEVVKHLGPAFPQSFRLRLSEVGKGLFIARYDRKGKKVNYVVNDSNTQITTELRLHGKKTGTMSVYDPVTGNITRYAPSSSLTIEAYKSVFIIE